MKYVALFFSLLSYTGVFAQNSRVYDLEKRLKQGDVKALFDIAPYFDSKTIYTETFANPPFKIPESGLAKRMVQKYTLFTADEIVISDQTSAGEFLSFLHKDSANIRFSSLTNTFLITPLTQRSATAEFREISKPGFKFLQSKYARLQDIEWIKANKIDALLAAKDPSALLAIASAYFKEKYWATLQTKNRQEYPELLQLLTGAEIAVADHRKQISYQYEREISSDAELNILIYFVNNYSKFVWDDTQGIFVNKKIKVIPAAVEQELFSLLRNRNDAVALHAFIKLTTCNPAIVTQLIKEQSGENDDLNNSLPTFLYDILQQVVLLTEYCRNNHINYTGSAALKKDINRLSHQLSFVERRTLEDKLIRTLTLDEITVLEYWSLIAAENRDLVFSTGRIVDIFYSRHWQEVVNNTRYLQLYLKKSYLYAHLGTSGNSGEFLFKFISNGPVVSEKLAQLQTDDKDIQTQVIAAQKCCTQKPHWRDVDKRSSNVDNDSSTTNIAAKIREITKMENFKDPLINLLSIITYNQIDTALQAIAPIKMNDTYHPKYSFMDDDWGLPIDGSFNTVAVRKEFLKQYRQLSEYDLYAYYLKRANIDYQQPDGTLDYDKIYDILKYNVADAFVMSGGVWKENEAYCIIKILELTRDTTLGFAKKRCHSLRFIGCSVDDRVVSWRQYLTEHNLLKQPHDEPVSFNYR